MGGGDVVTRRDFFRSAARQAAVGVTAFGVAGKVAAQESQEADDVASKEWVRSKFGETDYITINSGPMLDFSDPATEKAFLEALKHATGRRVIINNVTVTAGA